MTEIVYISSTYLDLSEYRAAARAQIQEMGLHEVSMETYAAEDARPIERCLADVRASDVYIGIFAWRYGYVPPGYAQSITELEYREAGEKGIERLVFLLDDDFPWAPKNMDAHHGDDSRIAQLREELRTEKLVSFFTSPG